MRHEKEVNMNVQLQACFLATVAQNRWVDLCIFTNVEDAIEWLLK
jgi:hypothetical protein